MQLCQFIFVTAEADIKQNQTKPPLPAPSFAEFLIQNGSSAGPAALNPRKAILSTEIQEITAEEFNQTIDAAERSAKEILALKLPRSCKRVAEQLANSLTHSKRSKPLLPPA